VAGFGIFVASADRLATLDRALGNRAPTHRPGLSQLGNELADTGWNFGEAAIPISYGIQCRRKRGKNKASSRSAHFVTFTPCRRICS
jgi:hypothetical protein